MTGATGSSEKMDALLLRDRAGLAADANPPTEPTPSTRRVRAAGDLNDQLAASLAERDYARVDAEAYRQTLVETEARLAALLPVVQAARALVEVERTRTSQTEHSSVWLEAHRARRGALVAAVDALPARTEEAPSGQ